MTTEEERILTERRARDRERWYRRYYGNKTYRERKLASKAEWQAANPERNVAAVQRFREKWGRWPAKAKLDRAVKAKRKVKTKVLASLARKTATAKKAAQRAKEAKTAAKVTKVAAKVVRSAKPVKKVAKVTKPAAKAKIVKKAAKPAKVTKPVKAKKVAAPVKKAKIAKGKVAKRKK